MSLSTHPILTIKLILKFPLLQRWELNLENKINFDIDYDKTDDKIDIIT